MARKKSELNYQEVLSKRLNDELENRRDKNYKYSQKDLADAIGIGYDSISKYLNGTRECSIDTLYKISEELDCSIEWLIREDVPKNRKPKEEETLISEISKYTGLSFYVINNLHHDFPDELIDIINVLLGSDESFTFLCKVYDYFNHYSSSAFVFPSTDNAIENPKTNRIEIDGIFDDFYDYIDGKMYLSNKRYETLRLENISDSIEIIRKQSKYHLQELIKKQKKLKNDLKKLKDDKDAKGIIEDIKLNLENTELEIQEIKKHIKEQK